MQNQMQQEPMNPDIWLWSNKQPKEMLYANLDIDTAAFEFPILDNTYSPFPDSGSWSATSSPISSSSHAPKSVPKDTCPLTFSFRCGSNVQPIHKAKPTKEEKLEVRLPHCFVQSKHQLNCFRNDEKKTVLLREDIGRGRKSTSKTLRISAKGYRKEMSPCVPVLSALGRQFRLRGLDRHVKKRVSGNGQNWGLI